MATSEEEEEQSFLQELQVLESIYLEELQISHEERFILTITLHPATGHDADSQYVQLTLQLSLPPQYPAEAPEFTIKSPRGLCDEQINNILRSLHSLAVQSIGCPVLYELIEKTKELLTASNIPKGHCVICLYGFQEGDCLTKTSCFHHFHSYCLGRYAEHCQEQDLVVLCPVCREVLTCNLNKLQAAPPPLHAEELYVPDICRLQQQKELRLVYERQVEKGGIIDLEAEKNRFFISIQEPPVQEVEVPVPRPEAVPVPRPEAVPVPRPEAVPVPRPEAVPVPRPEEVPDLWISKDPVAQISENSVAEIKGSWTKENSLPQMEEPQPNDDTVPHKDKKGQTFVPYLNDAPVLQTETLSRKQSTRAPAAGGKKSSMMLLCISQPPNSDKSETDQTPNNSHEMHKADNSIPNSGKTNNSPFTSRRVFKETNHAHSHRVYDTDRVHYTSQRVYNKTGRAHYPSRRVFETDREYYPSRTVHNQTDHEYYPSRRVHNQTDREYYPSRRVHNQTDREYYPSRRVHNQTDREYYPSHRVCNDSEKAESKPLTNRGHGISKSKDTQTFRGGRYAARGRGESLTEEKSC